MKQPGETIAAVLGEAGKGGVLMFAALILTGTLAGNSKAPLWSVLVGTATAFGFGLLGDLGATTLGFWGAAALIVLPLDLLLVWLLVRAYPGAVGKLMALEFLAFGLAYPCLAGLDDARSILYLKLAAFLFLAGAAWQLACQRPVSAGKTSIEMPAATGV